MHNIEKQVESLKIRGIKFIFNKRWEKAAETFQQAFNLARDNNLGNKFAILELWLDIPKSYLSDEMYKGLCEAFREILLEQCQRLHNYEQDAWNENIVKFRKYYMRAKKIFSTPDFPEHYFPDLVKQLIKELSRQGCEFGKQNQWAKAVYRYKEAQNIRYILHNEFFSAGSLRNHLWAKFPDFTKYFIHIFISKEIKYSQGKLMDIFDIQEHYLRAKERFQHKQWRESMDLYLEVKGKIKKIEYPISDEEEYFYGKIREIEQDLENDIKSTRNELKEQMINLHAQGKEAYRLGNWGESVAFLRESKEIDDKYIHDDDILDLPSMYRKSWLQNFGMTILNSLLFIIIQVVFLAIAITAFEDEIQKTIKPIILDAFLGKEIEIVSIILNNQQPIVIYQKDEDISFQTVNLPSSKSKNILSVKVNFRGDDEVKYGCSWKMEQGDFKTCTLPVQVSQNNQSDFVSLNITGDDLREFNTLFLKLEKEGKTQ